MSASSEKILPGDLVEPTFGWEPSLKSAQMLGRSIGEYGMYMGVDLETRDQIVLSPKVGLIFIHDRCALKKVK